MTDLYQTFRLLYELGVQVSPHGAAHILDDLYELLTILDRKATALMAFDGIIVAVIAFTVERGGFFRTHWAFRLFVFFTILVPLVAAALCLRVAEISYPFLDNVKITLGTPAAVDFSKEFADLAEVIARRTYIYQWGWRLSVLALLLYLIMLLLIMFGRIEPRPRPSSSGSTADTA